MANQNVTVEYRLGSKRSYKTIEIPSDTDLVAMAVELKQLGGDTHFAVVRQESCIGIYIPSRRIFLEGVDPFTNKQGIISAGGTIPPVCAFWYGSDVRFADTLFEQSPPKIYYYCKRVAASDNTLFNTNSEVFEEGTLRNVDVNDYERNPYLRKLCIKIHGDHCSICGLSFEKLYGTNAKGYIHVHHLEPLAAIGKSHIVDPQKDLIPVCPNCHAVLHMKNPPGTPEEIREILNTRIK